jgi:hypothetical protein
MTRDEAVRALLQMQRAIDDFRDDPDTYPAPIVPTSWPTAVNTLLLWLVDEGRADA